MDISLNGKLIDNLIFQPVNNSDPTAIFADEQISVTTENPPAKNIQFKLTYKFIKHCFGSLARLY